MSWSCATCTFLNEDPSHLACAICGTARQPAEGSAVSALNDARLQAALRESSQPGQSAASGQVLDGQTPSAAPRSSAPFGQASNSAPFGQTSNSAPFGQASSSAPFGQRSVPLGQASVPFGQAAIPAAPANTSAPAAAPASPPPEINLAGMNEAQQMAHLLKMTRADEHAAWVRRNKGVKVSSEPAAGEAGSTVIFLSLGDAQLQRRFWSDEAIQQVYNFVNTHEALFEMFGTGDVQLTDYNQHPPVVLGAEPAQREQTLAAFGLWPSGRLEVEPFGKEPSGAGSILPPSNLHDP